jgi:hypothetical protein
MKAALWTVMALGGLTLVACSSSKNGASSTGSLSTGSSAPASSSSAPTDFVDFVYQQIGTEPAFGSAPAATTALTTDLELGNAFGAASFSSGSALPAGTFQASVACAQAGTAACNPGVSADLNSNLN